MRRETRVPILIRPATLGDYDALCRLWETLDEHHRMALPNLFRSPSGPRWAIADVQALVDGPNSAILVAEDERQKVLGFATVVIKTVAERDIWIGREYAEVDNVVVQAASRRTGIGRCLMDASAEWAKQTGKTSLEVAVHDFNEGALSFYRSLGFRMAVHRMRRQLSAMDGKTNRPTG